MKKVLLKIKRKGEKLEIKKEIEIPNSAGKSEPELKNEAVIRWCNSTQVEYLRIKCMRKERVMYPLKQQYCK